MIVIIIIGVLATVGIMQYQGAIEKARGAEARQVLGQSRTQCTAIFMSEGSTAGCTNAAMRIGSEIPGPAACADTHWFRYASVASGVDTSVRIFTANRCTAATGGGKSPTGPAIVGSLALFTDYDSGTDIWNNTGGY